MSGRDIGKIIEIMKHDFHASFSNPIVIAVLIGVIILPSLYALLNIEACWDPYGNTGEVEFAIANLDNGTTYENTTLNIGNELVKELKNNDKFKWTFVTEDELRQGVHDGDYYAGIIIPKNLSKNVISIASDNPKQAQLEYIVNVKANPVASKLSDNAANALYTKLNAKIVEFINLAAYGKLGELQDGLSSGAGQLASGGQQLAAGSAQISSGANQVSSGENQLQSGANELQKGAGKVQQGASAINQGAEKVQSSESKIQQGADKVQQGASAINQGAEKVQSSDNQLQQGAAKVQQGASAINQGAEKVQSSESQVQQGAAEVQQGAEQLKSTVDPSTLPPGPIKDYVNANMKLTEGSGQVAGGASQLASGSTQLAEKSSDLASGSSEVAGGASQLASGSTQLAQSSSKLANGSSEVAGGASQLASGSTQLAQSSSKLANGSSEVAGGASQLANGSLELAEGSLSLAAGSQLISQSATQALFTASSSLSSTADSLSNITGINETKLGEYFFTPVKLDRQEIFPVPDYGSNVSPFYLVLSMWVGALITCVLIDPKSSEGTKYSPFEMYSGKLMFYIVISILQAIVTLIGANILGIHVENSALFITSALLVSVVFMILIYSIISALSTVGKGIVVVLLVLQISATGGIYPIQIMNGIFKSIYQYMPMTYAIKLIREAQLGVVWSNYTPALIILLAIGVITVIVSILIKKKADKPSKYFEERLKDSGLF